MSSGGRLFVILAGSVCGVAGGAWLSGVVLILRGPDAQVHDAGAATVAFVLLVLIACLVFQTGGLRWGSWCSASPRSTVPP